MRIKAETIQVKTMNLTPWQKKKKDASVFLRKNGGLYLLVLPAVIHYIVFCYLPIYGVQIAFRDFIPVRGFFGSEWVGLKHFIRFFESFYFKEIIWNTLAISFYSLVASFPLPILLALMLNYQRNLRFKKLAQTVSYAPHFISTVVIVGMLKIFTSPMNGIFNKVIAIFGGEVKHFMAEPNCFRHLYVWSGIWQELGWSSILYIGALSTISVELHEAAIVDGASILKRIWHIDLPGIVPTIIILLILRTGSILDVGFEKIYLMQNNLNTSVSEVIATYSYKVGLIENRYSFSSAIGLFNSLINFIFLITVNSIARKVSETSLF
jgi:putative aldouronate transport system permease protein